MPLRHPAHGTARISLALFLGFIWIALSSGCGTFGKRRSSYESGSAEGVREIELDDGSLTGFRPLARVNGASTIYRHFSKYFVPIWEKEQRETLAHIGPVNGAQPRIDGKLPLYFLASKCTGRPLYVFDYHDLRLSGEEPHPDYRFTGNAGMPIMIYTYDRRTRRFDPLFDEEILDLLGVETNRDGKSAECPSLIVRVHGSVLGREGVESGNCRVSYNPTSGKYSFPDTPPDSDRNSL